MNWCAYASIQSSNLVILTPEETTGCLLAKAGISWLLIRGVGKFLVRFWYGPFQKHRSAYRIYRNFLSGPAIMQTFNLLGTLVEPG